jgi:ABC-2 type transport system permease protein
VEPAMNAIYILWLRQLKRYSRSRARMVMSMMQPLMFLAALGMGFSPVFKKAGEGNYLQFLGPGVIAMSVMFTGVFSGIEILWDRQFGFLKETLVAPVSRLQIVFGRTLGSATVAVFQGLLMLIICLIAGVRIHNPALLPAAVGFMFLIALFFTSIGTAVGSLMEDMQGFQLVTNVLVMPLFFFSNALFPLAGLSRPLRALLHANPLVYGMDGLRGSLAGTFNQGAGVDVLILGGLTAVVMALAAWLFSRIQL